MKDFDPLEARRIAVEATEKGISIETRVNAQNSPLRTGEKSGRGRPQANILSRGRDSSKGSRLTTDLVYTRSVLLSVHKIWRQKESLNLKFDTRFPSVSSKLLGKPTWTVYWAAELGWLLMGHSGLEKRRNRRQWYLKDKVPFVDETYYLWCYINNEVENTAHCTKGPKPNAEKLFKTALAMFVARNLNQPKGGNWTVLPTEREISQVWYMLFGEHEPHGTIKNRLRTLLYYLATFDRHYPSPDSQRFSFYPKLGEALKHKLVPKKKA